MDKKIYPALYTPVYRRTVDYEKGDYWMGMKTNFTVYIHLSTRYMNHNLLFIFLPLTHSTPCAQYALPTLKF